MKRDQPPFESATATSLIMPQPQMNLVPSFDRSAVKKSGHTPPSLTIFQTGNPDW
jgi:hypothetical protein